VGPAALTIDRAVFGGLRKRRSSSEPDPDVLDALDAFRVAATLVGKAKGALLMAVPGRRGSGTPLAEALAAFEEHLHAARRSIGRWTPNAAETERRKTLEAIEEALRRAEGLRLNASPQGYQELYALLGETLDPLDALSEVAERLGGGSY
jgi:hypothetical protein